MFKDTRAEIIHRRTYSRPIDEANNVWEDLEETTDRIISHQRWLWERAQGEALSDKQEQELEQLHHVYYNLEASPSGRTRWLGGTPTARNRESSQFNCSFSKVSSAADVVDLFWLLLQGCGVGFKPEMGSLRGFHRPVRVQVLRSKLKHKGGQEFTAMRHFGGGDYQLTIGDSAEAWARSIGKLLTLPSDCTELTLDFSHIRAGGERLAGYGWISSGDQAIHDSFVQISKILNEANGRLLDDLEIMDIMNLLGATLSSRRSAEITLMDIDNPLASDFIMAKKDHWIDRPWRAQSNNSVMFWSKPSALELKGVFQKMIDGGGSEPGFINAAAAKKKANYFSGLNPCAEILLADKSVCNLSEIDLSKFADEDRWMDLLRTVRLVARANYRQTCVNFKDGVLQDKWHENNDYLRLTGVGITGIVEADFSGDQLAALRTAAHASVDAMADELDLPRSKMCTTIKPSGSLSKVFSTTEGVHKPLGRYIFNNVRFSASDPLLPRLEAAGYDVMEDPYDSEGARIVTFPVAWETIEFTDLGDGKLVNDETALEQLERYKMVMENYVDHNCSITVSYSPDEVDGIIEWLLENWDLYIGVSWIFRTDPSKTAEDLGYPYLPQEVVTKQAYDEYVARISDVDLEGSDTFDLLEGDECSTGSCPVR